METRHEPRVLGKEPVGNLCVVRDDTLSSWTVLVCPGMAGQRKPLAKFSTLGEAEAFANAELAKLNANAGQGETKRYILHVDDCPCWQKQL